MPENQYLNLSADEFDPADIEKGKTMAGLAYFIFFLPLIVCPDSSFGKFHANQALLLFITGVVGSTVLSFIPLIGWMLLPFFSLAILILAVMGLVNGLQGKAKRLPLIGNYSIIK